MQKFNPTHRNLLIVLKQLSLALILSTIMFPASAARFDHVIWDELLREHVYMTHQRQTSRVNYSGFTLYYGQLQKYLSQVSAVKESDFLDWDKPEQLAFLINAYNAFTVEMILRSYSSIASLRAYAPANIAWKSRLISMLINQRKLKFIPLFGEILSLDDIEEGMIRKPGNYDEPRIHFALNRASIDCPALLNRAYNGIELEHQLEAATRAFLADRLRNRLNEKVYRLEVSKIFDWYSADFARSWHGWTSLIDFFSHYRDSLADTPQARDLFSAGNLEIQFLEFDWMLNEKQ